LITFIVIVDYIFDIHTPEFKEITMLVRRIYAVAVTAITLLLTACGGGGGGSAGPVSSTETFQLRAGWVNYITDTRSLPFTLTGSVSGTAVTGSGTLTQGSLSSAVFESQNALKKTSVVTGSISGGGQTFPLGVTTTAYVDSNYTPLGSSGAEYAVYSSGNTIPLTARVSDTGIWYQSVRYTSSSKTSRLGTATASYVLEPDTASTALLKIVNVEKDTYGTTTSTQTLTFRITPAGGLTRLSEVGSEGNTALTISYQ
jgi:hypothetical protein